MKIGFGHLDTAYIVAWYYYYEHAGHHFYKTVPILRAC